MGERATRKKANGSKTSFFLNSCFHYKDKHPKALVYYNLSL